MDGLQGLLGLVVIKAKEVHDYTQIMFSDGSTLSVFNNCVYDDGSVNSFEGKAVKSVEDSSDAVLIVFDDERLISIGLSEGDYNGPEAMMLSKQGVSPIVWN